MAPLQLTCNPSISAIYYALLQTGYSYYAIKRNESHIRALEAFQGRWSNDVCHAYFAAVRQDTCDVYPYWPRAALLETATFYTDPAKGCFTDFDALYRRIMSMGNLRPEERDDRFWHWLEEFPENLQAVLSSSGFADYLRWENVWLKEQEVQNASELRLLEELLNQFNTLWGFPVPQVEIVLSPIKCVYSADYHLWNQRLIFSSGAFSAASVVHECLHPQLHPLVEEAKASILAGRPDFGDLDSSYSLDGGEAGLLNAFEESLVRSLASLLLAGQPPVDLEQFLKTLSNSR